MIAVRVRNVWCSAGRRVAALRGVSFDAGGGEIVGVIGTHGAGKSNLLRVLAGRAVPRRGEVRWEGTPPPAAIGYVAAPPLVPPELSAADWLTYLASHTAANAAERLDLVRTALEFADLGSDAEGRAVGLPRASAHCLAVAAAVLRGRTAIVLDEILAGLDIPTLERIGGQLARVASRGRLVILATQDLATVERIATRVVVLRDGTAVADERTGTLLRGRIVELTLNGGGLELAQRLQHHFAGCTRTGTGVRIPLTGALTIEYVLGICRAERIAVAGSRIRYRRLEDLMTPRSGEGGV